MIGTCAKRYLLLALLFIIAEITLIGFIDLPLSLALRDLDATHPDVINFFRAYTDLGKGIWYSAAFGVGAVLAFTASRLQPETSANRLRFRYYAEQSAFLFVAVTGAGLSADLIKLIAGRARPKLFKTAHIFGFDPFNTTSADWRSFPSGHSVTVFAAAIAIAALQPRWRWPLLAAAFAVALSRIMINAHYLADTVAGGVWGTLFACWITYLYQRYRRVPVAIAAQQSYESKASSL